MPALKVLDADLYRVELENGFGPRKPGDAGIDLRCSKDIRIEPFDTYTVPLGIAFQLDPDTVGWMTGRSSLTSAYHAISTEGKIDSGYRGEVHHFVHALDRPVQLNRGERICQLVVVQIVTAFDSKSDAAARWRVVDELEPSERGARGLGSTGRE